MHYRVVEGFFDLEDHERRYRAGDEYPRAGYKPSPERLEALLSGKNRLGKPLIEEIEKPQKQPAKARKKA